MEPRVSVITPCYNGERFLDYYFESILRQDYDNVEVIFVDDGSQDDSLNIARKWRDRIEERGFIYVIIEQENRGQAAAINRGLAIYSGDYLMWSDVDDVLYPSNISSKVRFLESNLDCGFVQCWGEVVEENCRDKRVGVLKRIPGKEDDIFSDYLQGNNVVYPPGVYMVRRNAISDAIPSNHIYESREGQNFQLLLPIMYSHKCGYIDEILFKCVSHQDSHSRRYSKGDELLNRFLGMKDVCVSVVKEMKTQETKEILDSIDIIYAKKIVAISDRLPANRMGIVGDSYMLLRKAGELSASLRLSFLRASIAARLKRKRYD